MRRICPLFFCRFENDRRKKKVLLGLIMDMVNVTNTKEHYGVG